MVNYAWGNRTNFGIFLEFRQGEGVRRINLPRSEPELFMNDLTISGSLAQRPVNTPERPLTVRTLTPITQNRVALIHQRSSAS